MTEDVQQDMAHTAELTTLYTGFVNASMANNVSNTVVAQASIMMLTDALTSMAQAYDLQRQAYEGIAGEVIQYLNNVSMQLSHDIAEAVQNAKAQAVTETVKAEDADESVEN